MERIKTNDRYPRLEPYRSMKLGNPTILRFTNSIHIRKHERICIYRELGIWINVRMRFDGSRAIVWISKTSGICSAPLGYTIPCKRFDMYALAEGARWRKKGMGEWEGRELNRMLGTKWRIEVGATVIVVQVSVKRKLCVTISFNGISSDLNLEFSFVQG